MNVYIVTTDEPLYLTRTLKNILDRDKEKIIKGVILLKPETNKGGITKLARQFYVLYDFSNFLRLCLTYILNKIFRYLPKCLVPFSFKTILDVTGDFSLPLYFVSNINESSWLDKFKRLNSDLLVSLSASQIFKEELLNIPTLGVVNVHSAPLPKYRGLMPSFWQLYNGEKEGAVTIHWMEKGIDSGDIILQKRFPIKSDETQHSLIQKGKAISGEMIIEVIDLLKKFGKNVPTIPNDVTKATYYSFPTKIEAKEFRKRGNKFR
jgi:methionyl-tRNA formyltransferase